MRTLSSFVVLLILIIFEVCIAWGGKVSKREVETRRDLTERVDSMEKNMGLMKMGFRSIAFLMADLLMGEKDKNVTADEKQESINGGDYKEAPYTTLEKLDDVGFSTYVYNYFFVLIFSLPR